MNFFANIWDHVAGVAAASELEAQKIAEYIVAGAEVAYEKIASLVKYAEAQAPVVANDVAALAPLAAVATTAAAAALPPAEAVVVAGDIATVMAGAKAMSSALTELNNIQQAASTNGQGQITTTAQDALALYQATQAAKGSVATARASAIAAVQAATGPKGAAPASA